MVAYPGGGLGRRLLLARARHQQTQAEAAKAAGVGHSVWQRIEAGGPPPRRAATVGRIAAYLGCDPAELIDGGSSDADGATQAAAPVVAGSLADEASHGQ